MVSLLLLLLLCFSIFAVYVYWTRARAFWSATFIHRCHGKISIESRLRDAMKELETSQEAYDRWAKWYLQGKPLELTSAERQTLMLTTALSTQKIPNRYIKAWVR
jgi:hypothetical protein